jgi:hypothetical protein
MFISKIITNRSHCENVIEGASMNPDADLSRYGPEVDLRMPNCIRSHRQRSVE